MVVLVSIQSVIERALGLTPKILLIKLYEAVQVEEMLTFYVYHNFTANCP